MIALVSEPCIPEEKQQDRSGADAIKKITPS